MRKERFETFVDALLAIIMTILVLELQKPESLTLKGFWDLRQNFFAFALSFFWLGAMWINMHNNWYRVRYINTRIMWLGLIMLFFSSLFPYATSIVSENFDSKGAQIFYGIIVLLVTLSNVVLYRAIRVTHSGDSEFRFAQNSLFSTTGGILIDVGIKIIGLLLTIFVYPEAMIYSVLITFLFIIVPNQLFQRENVQFKSPDQRISDK